MKISTRIRKQFITYAQSGLVWVPDHEIVFMVDCEPVSLWTFLHHVDEEHKRLTAQGCTFLPKESPVINSDGRIVLHYTSTTYRDWCNR